MPPKKKIDKKGLKQFRPPLDEEVSSVIASLQRIASKKVRDGMARYAIPSDKAFGVSVGALRLMSKKLGRSHGLAVRLWETGWYEARLAARYPRELLR